MEFDPPTGECSPASAATGSAGCALERSLAAFTTNLRESATDGLPVAARPVQAAGGIVKRFVLGRGAFDQPGAAGIVLLFRQLLLDMIREENLLEKYDRFIITRSDYFYGAPHPSCDLLDPTFAWLPEGEDYRGLCDRHWVLSRDHVEPCLDLLGPIICDTDNLYREMQSDNRWNIEKYVKHIWEKRGVRVRRYPRTMFLVRDADDRTNRSAGTYNPAVSMIVKYNSEFEQARANIVAFRDETCWKAWNRDVQMCAATHAP